MRWQVRLRCAESANPQFCAASVQESPPIAAPTAARLLRQQFDGGGESVPNVFVELETGRGPHYVQTTGFVRCKSKRD